MSSERLLVVCLLLYSWNGPRDWRNQSPVVIQEQILQPRAIKTRAIKPRANKYVDRSGYQSCRHVAVAVVDGV